MAGKPERPLLDAAIRLVDSKRPLVVGDRLDTDIACAVAAGSPSLLVFTGVSTTPDLLAAVPEQRPTYLAFDLRGLVEEDHAVRIPAASSSSSSLEWSVTTDNGALVLAGHGGADGAVSDASALRALAMLTGRAWASGVTARARTGPRRGAALTRCGLRSAEHSTLVRCRRQLAVWRHGDESPSTRCGGRSPAALAVPPERLGCV